MKRASSAVLSSLIATASRSVLAGGMLLLLAVITGTASLMWLEHRRTQATHRQQLDLQASVMEAHASQVFENTRLALDFLAKKLRIESLTPAQVEAEQSYRLQGLPFLRSIAIVDEQGMVLASTAASDRGGFVDLQRLTRVAPQDGQVVIGPWLAGRGLVQDPRPSAATPAGLGFIPVVRRVQLSPDAALLLVAQVNPDALANHQLKLQEIGLPGTQVLLALTDGTLLTQIGNDTLAPGSSLAAHPLFRTPLAALKGSYGPVDTFQTPSLGAWHASSNHPLVSMVEQPYKATTDQWLAALRGPLLFMTVALAMVGFMVQAAWRSNRAREAAQRERDAALEETAHREQELSILFKSVQELIFRTDAAGVLQLVNARWRAITGRPAARAHGQRLRDAVAPDCSDEVDALFDPHRGTGVRTAQVHMRGQQGEMRVLEFSVVPLTDPDGQLRGFAGSASDITALLAAQQRLQEHLAYTERILECNPLPISLTDMQGRFISVNQAWESFMGRQRTEVLGRRSFDFLPEQEAQAYEAYTEPLLREGGPVRYEERVRRPDGNVRDVQISKVLLRSPKGHPIGILSTKLDITEFLAARDMAEQASRTKSEFVANISHELRTPLQSILGFSELGLVRGRHQNTLSAMFSDIHAAGQRMLGLVNDLLDISKIESTVGAFHFERTDVRDLIEDVGTELELLLGDKRLRLGLRLGRTPLIAKVDPTRLQQVVRNVLSNAVKFSPQDSIIDITAEGSDDDTIRIEVRDHGPGIPPQELEAVFEAFVQSSQTRDGSGGTGLGLAICRKILSAHGGHIHASNAPDGGCIFHIALPTAHYTDTMPAPLT